MNRGFCSCLGLRRISFVRAFAESSWTAVLVGRTEAVNTQLSSEQTGLHGIPLFVLQETSPERFSSIIWWVRGSAARIPGEPTRRRPVLPVLSPPRRPAVSRPAPTHPWYIRILESSGDYGRPNGNHRTVYFYSQNILLNCPWAVTHSAH